MTLELMRDAVRDTGWWLLDTGSEQSFVDTADPLHLEFEYVQMMAYVLETFFGDTEPLRALHLGGGLCTVPRWLATTHPGSRQRVAELSPQVAKLAASLGTPIGVRIVVADALDVLAKARGASNDLVVCDVYEGPDTVTKVFTVEAIAAARRTLAAGGLHLCNVSDATPFAMAQVVAAALRAQFAEVVMLAEPPVLRGRRSGNLVLAATDRELPIAELTRRASGGPVRARVVNGDALDEFIADAAPASSITEIPASGESVAALATVLPIGKRSADPHLT
jgi:spermidine synthase